MESRSRMEGRSKRRRRMKGRHHRHHDECLGLYRYCAITKETGAREEDREGEEKWEDGGRRTEVGILA